MNILIWIGSFIGLLILLMVYFYNALVKADKKALEGWSRIDVALKKRYDLVPNLVETVKAYAKHEKETLKEVVNLRNVSMEVDGVEEKAGSEENLSQGIKTIFALAEQYPELKADQSFNKLQKKLADIEDDIQMARRYYNATVRDLDIMIDSFPSNIIAKIFGFKDREFFQVESPKQRRRIRIVFGDKE